MRWRESRQSQNVEDRRGMSRGGMAIGGGLGGIVILVIALQGYVVPDSFTHGSSEQRIRWFRKGLETGDIRQSDPFSVRSL